MNETIIFMGTPDFSVPVLRALQENHGISMVISQPDKPVGRKRVLTPPPVAAAAAEMDILLSQRARIRDSGVIEEIKVIKLDVSLTTASGPMLPKHLLDIPPLGAVKVDASLLPRHR